MYISFARESKELKSPWYGECCQPDGSDLNWEDDSGAHYVLLAIFVVLCLLTLGLWRTQRDHQALKARKWGITASHTGTLVLLHAVTTLNHCMGPSASCGLQMVEWFLLLPLVLFHYANSATRLLFIHQWSQTKLKEDGNTTQLWYYQHQYVLKTYAYLIMKLVMVLVGVALILALYFSQENFFGGNDEMWAVTRCSWWQIPDEYQQPTMAKYAHTRPEIFVGRSFPKHSSTNSLCGSCSQWLLQLRGLWVLQRDTVSRRHSDALRRRRRFYDGRHVRCLRHRW